MDGNRWEEVRESKSKANMILRKYHPCLIFFPADRFDQTGVQVDSSYSSRPVKVTSGVAVQLLPAHALGAFCDSVSPQAGLQQWRSLIAAKKRRQSRMYGIA